MKAGEAYWDIVWKQFKKNRFALAALAVLAPMCLVAIFAPAIASDQPLVWQEDGATCYPWFRSLFNPAETVDYVFNMALVAFVPWVAVSLPLNGLWRRRGVAGRPRVLRVALVYLGLTLALSLAFSFDGLRPNNRYKTRAFSEELFAARQAGKAVSARYPLIPFGPTEQDLSARYEPPGYCKPAAEWQKANDPYPHWWGTDDSGRDVLVRMIYGSRISLTVGVVAVGLYLSIGIFIGAVAGYFGGVVDMFISRVIEIIMVFPAFFLILTLVSFLGQSIYVIMGVIGLTGWPGIARLIRGEVLKQRALDYVAAARALGASHRRIIFRHILPNALSPALVAAPFGVAGAIITEASLSLLGFGVRPPAPTWGSLLQLGHSNYTYWWLIVFPSLAIFVSVTVFNLVGSGLRDAMDPRLRM